MFVKVLAASSLRSAKIVNTSKKEVYRQAHLRLIQIKNLMEKIKCIDKEKCHFLIVFNILIIV